MFAVRHFDSSSGDEDSNSDCQSLPSPRVIHASVDLNKEVEAIGESYSADCDVSMVDKELDVMRSEVEQAEITGELKKNKLSRSANSSCSEIIN